MIVYDINNANIVVGDRFRASGLTRCVVGVRDDRIEIIDNYGRTETISLMSLMTTEIPIGRFRRYLQIKKL